MTLSPTRTSIGIRSPFSIRPGPTASTSPWVGFSLAVSGMYSGPRMDSPSSAGRITARSSRGWILILGLALIAVDIGTSSDLRGDFVEGRVADLVLLYLGRA